MNISSKCINLIKSFEGYSSSAYPDPKTNGRPYTIGWGSTMLMTGKIVKLGDIINEVEAENLLIWEINNKSKVLQTLPLNQNQVDALTSWLFNLGIGNWNKSTLKKKVTANPNDLTIKDEFMKWVSPGTNVEKGLKIRRAAEAALYFTPIV